MPNRPVSGWGEGGKADCQKLGHRNQGCQSDSVGAQVLPLSLPISLSLSPLCEIETQGNIVDKGVGAEKVS